MAATLDDYDAALTAGDLPRLVALFKADEARGTQRDARGDPLLHRTLAFRRGLDRGGAIAALLAAGADPRVRNVRGDTALHRAAYADCADCVAGLLKAGADPNASGHAGNRPLHYCDAPALPLLLAAGADPSARADSGRVPLHGNPNRDERLLAPGVNVVDESGLTPLHVAAFDGEVERVDWLLAHGADATRLSTARYSNAGAFDPAEFAAPAPYDFPPGQRAYDLARFRYEATKWSTGSKYLMVMERLDKLTPRRSLFRR